MSEQPQGETLFHPRENSELGEAATCKDYLQVRQEGKEARHLHKVEVAA